MADQKRRRLTPDERRKEILDAAYALVLSEGISTLTMEKIANQFKIPVRDLYFKNRMAYGTTPIIGQQLVTDHYIHFMSIPKTIKTTDDQIHQHYLFEEEITISSL